MFRITIFRIVFIFCAIGFNLQAQEEVVEVLNADSIISMGIRLHDDQKYDEAIEMYSRVSKCDPSYSLCCYETALTFHNMGENMKALEKCLEAEDLEFNSPELATLMLTLYEETGKPEKGLEIAEKALRTWPYNQSILYNMAVTLSNTGRTEEAEPYLLKSIRVNPYHASSHLALALVNFKMGRKGKAVLAYNFASLVNPTVAYLTEYEQMIQGRKDSLLNPLNFKEEEGINKEYWNMLKQVINSEIAFREDFEYNENVDFSIFRMSLSVFRKLSFNPADTSLYNQFYNRFFGEIMKLEYFSAFMNYMLNNVNHKAAGEWVAKNGEQLDEFIAWAGNFINELRAFGMNYENERKGIYTWQFDENGDLTGIGQFNKDDLKKNGKWVHINPEGWIYERGIYKNDLGEDIWTGYYIGGLISMQMNFKNGEFDGISKTFFKDGSLESSHSFKNGSREGITEYFTPSGLLSSSVNYGGGLASGKASYFYYDQGFSQILNFENDSMNGPFTETWSNGILKTEGTYKANEYNGRLKAWHPNGELRTDMGYNNGKEAGKWKDYYRNGGIEGIGEYDSAGNRSGTLVTYDIHGNSYLYDSIYQEGKLTGVKNEYYPDGSVRTRSVYTDDIPVHYEAYDRDHRLLFESSSRNDSTLIREFYEDGRLMTSGKYFRDKLCGKWLKYSPQGVPVEEWNYREDLLDGLQKTYYPNGKIKEIYNCDSGLIIGLYKEYFMNGQIKTAGSYNAVGPDGEWKSFYSDGSPGSNYFFKAGEQTGRSFAWDPGGNLTGEDTYDEMSRLIRKKYYYPDGELLADVKVDKPVTEISLDYKNGNPYFRYEIIDSRIHGTYTEFYPDGSPSRIMNLEHGMLHGQTSSYDPLGNLEFEMGYIYSSAEGKGKWFENGVRDYEALYMQDMNQDSAFDFSSIDGSLSRIMLISEDKRTGYSYYFTGNEMAYRLNFFEDMLLSYSYLDSKGNFIEDVRIDSSTSMIRCYFKNGKKSTESEIKNGIYHGARKDYYPDGQVEYTGNYLEGENHGEFRSYYPGGSLRSESHYKYDELSGPYRLYYPDGKLMISGSYEVNEKNGEWKFYNKDGSLKKTVRYIYGKAYEME